MLLDYFLRKVLHNQLNNEKKDYISHDYVSESGQCYEYLVHVIRILEIIQIFSRQKQHIDDINTKDPDST